MSPSVQPKPMFGSLHLVNRYNRDDVSFYIKHDSKPDVFIWTKDPSGNFPSQTDLPAHHFVPVASVAEAIEEASEPNSAFKQSQPYEMVPKLIDWITRLHQQVQITSWAHLEMKGALAQAKTDLEQNQDSIAEYTPTATSSDECSGVTIVWSND